MLCTTCCQSAHHITLWGSCGCATAADCWARASWPLPASWLRESLVACPDPACASTALQWAPACHVQDQPCQRQAPSVPLLSLILLSLTLTQQRASVRLGPCVPQHHALRQCQPSNARVQWQSVCLAAGHSDISCGLERPLHRVMATVCVSAMPGFGLDEACKSFEAEKTP